MKYTLLFVFYFFFYSSSLAQQLWGVTASFYGSTSVIFRTDVNGDDYTEVYTYGDSNGGENPYGSLMLANDNKLYGMTGHGGTNNKGTIFQFDPITEEYVKIHDFDFASGAFPISSLVQADNGILYGVTNSGGAYNDGVLFSYNINEGAFSKLKDFAMTDAARPDGDLIQANDGKLYGLSKSGGIDSGGCLFSYDYNSNELNCEHSFIVGSEDGHRPKGSLMEASNGLLYGYSDFGLSGGGVLFQFDPIANLGDKFHALHTFDETAPGNENGYGLETGCIEASNGKIYGMTQHGGIHELGTIFEYNPDTGIVNKLYDFDDVNNGHTPFGTLMEASNGKLYGLTDNLGYGAKLFQFDMADNSYTVKADVSGRPHYTKLIETNIPGLDIQGNKENIAFSLYPNPVQNELSLSFTNMPLTAQISIVNLLGEEVFYSKRVLQTIDTSALMSGIYFLKVQITDQHFYSKFVKE